MVQLVCPCLNIRVHGKGTSLQLCDVASLNLSDDASADDFFRSGVYEVLLDLGGVTKAQKSLCSTRCIDGWVITSCVGCDLDIYAKHIDDNDHVIVSNNMEKDASHITALLESEHYSPLFKLLLPEVNDNFTQNNFGIELCSTNGSLEQAIQHVQQQVAAYFREEQKAMEERIRLFTEQQQTRYATLQQKVRKHKQAMIYLLLKLKENRKPALSEAMMESISPLTSPVSPIHHSSDESSSSTDSALTRSESTECPVEASVQVEPQIIRPFRRFHSVNNPPRIRTRGGWKTKHVSRSIDVGGVFEMEGFDTHDDASPFYNSDDGDTDESSAAEDNAVPAKQPQNMYANSLPISVPVWPRNSRFNGSDEEEKVLPLRDPEQIAASMRALAQSVHDGTEMFGDLPRRRLNTGDLIKSRPI